MLTNAFFCRDGVSQYSVQDSDTEDFSYEKYINKYKSENTIYWSDTYYRRFQISAIPCMPPVFANVENPEFS
jgi:hypothetical protein